MSISYHEIKKIIDMWDPIELLITHAPPDEYDSESKEIFKAFDENSNITLNDLSKLIFKVFYNAFGGDSFTKDMDECKKIAETMIR